MIFEFLIKGILIGLIFGVPAGAIGALTVQRTVEKGFVAGFVTGAGSSAADLLYSAVGVFGITIISDFLEKYKDIIGNAGGILIILLGLVIWRKKEKAVEKEDTSVKSSLMFFFLSSFVTAIMNPATVFSFMLAFTAFNITGNITPMHGTGLMLGILAGTLCWWLILSGAVSVCRKRITDKIYIWLNRILGSLMMILGVAMILR